MEIRLGWKHRTTSPGERRLKRVAEKGTDRILRKSASSLVVLHIYEWDRELRSGCTLYRLVSVS